MSREGLIGQGGSEDKINRKDKECSEDEDIDLRTGNKAILYSKNV